MKKNTIVMAGALLIGGLLTLNSIAFADTVDAKTSASILKRGLFETLAPGKMGGFDHRGQKDMVFIQKEDWSLKLKALVTEGTINQATADKMQAYLTEQENTMKTEMDKLQAMTAEQRKTYIESNKSELVKKVDLFNAMVEKGILTQQQADAIKPIQQPKDMVFIQKHDWNLQLKDLVAGGTINQATADKMQAYLTEQENTMKAEMDKLQGMTAEQRKTYIESKKSELVKKIDILSSMVEKGILTQPQADAIKAIQQTRQAEEKLAQQAKHLEYTTAALTKLVESKVITSEQMLKINEYIVKEQAARETEMEKIKAMTEEEATTYFKSNAVDKDNMLAPLVTSKVLTQAQADAVEKVLHSKGAPMGFGKGFVRGMIKR
jgi:Tfp pilus assembly protein PilP